MTQHDEHGERERHPGQDEQREAPGLIAEGQPPRLKAHPVVQTPIADGRYPDEDRRHRQKQPAPRAVRNTYDEGRDRCEDSGRKRRGDADHKLRLPQTQREIRPHLVTDGEEREDQRREQQPAHRARDGRPQPAHRRRIRDKRLDEIGCGDHVLRSCLLSILRKLLSARWITTFSAATVIPLTAAASLNDISLSFNSLTASRCPRGRRSTASLSARASEAASW